MYLMNVIILPLKFRQQALSYPKSPIKKKDK